MFRASLCPSSGEQDVCYCVWCWEIVKNKHLKVVSCWFSLSLHNLLRMHGHRHLKLSNNSPPYCPTQHPDLIQRLVFTPTRQLRHAERQSAPVRSCSLWQLTCLVAGSVWATAFTCVRTRSFASMTTKSDSSSPTWRTTLPASPTSSDRPAIYRWVITQRVLSIPYRRFDTNYRVRLQISRIKKPFKSLNVT